MKISIQRGAVSVLPRGGAGASGMSLPDPTSLRSVMEQGNAKLTAGERRIVQAVMADYPYTDSPEPDAM